MNPPWIPLHIGDYLADTGHLTTAQHGAYLLLIFHYWRTGALPADEKQLASIAKLTLDKWRKMSPVIQGFFEIRQSRWNHGRIEKDLLAASEKSARRKSSGRLGGLEKARRISSNATAMPEQCSSYLEPRTKNQEKIQTSSDAHAPRDVRRDLFSTGLRMLAEITGKTPDSCRSLVGKWLKLVNDEAIHVLGAIEDAHRNRIADPVSWISASLNPRPRGGPINGHKQHPTDRCEQIADNMDRAIERETVSTRGSAGGGPDAVSLLEWRRNT